MFLLLRKLSALSKNNVVPARSNTCQSICSRTRYSGPWALYEGKSSSTFSCAEYLAASTLHSGNRPCFDEQMPNSLHFCIIRFLKSGIPAPAGCPGEPSPGHKEFPASSSVKRLEMTRWHLRGCFLFSMLNDLRFPFFHQVNRSSKRIIFSCILQELPDV